MSALDAGETRRAELPVGEYVAIVMDQPDLTIGPLHEGTSYDGGVPGRNGGIAGALSQNFEFYGRHQPHTLRLPRDWDGVSELPVLFALHGLGGTHAGWVTYDSFVDQVLEHPDHDSLVLVAPLARGSSFYADYGELDALATLADAEARLPIDPDRRYLAGYSMGGLRHLPVRHDATGPVGQGCHLRRLHGRVRRQIRSHLRSRRRRRPDRVSATVTELTGVGGGRMDQAAKGNPVALLGNVREIPILHATGSNDEIVPTTGQYRAAQQLDELDYRHRFDLYPGYEHLSFALLDDRAGVREWFGDRERSSAPRQVTYSFSPSWADPALDLGIRHDRAYWLHGLVRREGNDDPVLDSQTYGRIHATFHAIPDVDHEVEPIREPAMGNAPHVRLGDRWIPLGQLPTTNRLDVELTNVSAATVDTTRASLAPEGLHVELVTDGPTTLTISGDFAGVGVTVAGGTVAATAAGLAIATTAAGTVTVSTSA